MSQILQFKKVPVLALLDILENLYIDGATYVDIEGVSSAEEFSDSIKIIVRPEYVEVEETEDGIIFDETNITPISEIDDLRNLI
jgi:hypothetical protein